MRVSVTCKPWLVSAIIWLWIVVGSYGAFAGLPEGYPSDYGQLVTAAQKEGELVIYADLPSRTADLLIKDFAGIHPGIKVRYQGQSSNNLLAHFVQDMAAKAASADVVWSSAIQLQAKLIRDGYPLKYRSAEAGHIVPWADFSNAAYATNFDPITIIYNRELFPEGKELTSRPALRNALSSPKLKGKVVALDPDKNEIAYLLLSQEMSNSGDSWDFWEFTKYLGKTDIRLQPSIDVILDKIGRGDALIGYNLLGSQALAMSSKYPSIAFTVFQDYGLSTCSSMFIYKKAQHPNAAKLWLDYVLSRRGQQILVDSAGLFSVRHDVKGRITVDDLGNRGKIFNLGRTLTDYSDAGMKYGFLKRWKSFLEGTK